MKMKFLGNLFSIVVAFAACSGTAWAEVGGTGAIVVPEIPAGSAPFLLMGLLGFVLWIRNFVNKK